MVVKNNIWPKGESSFWGMALPAFKPAPKTLPSAPNRAPRPISPFERGRPDDFLKREPRPTSPLRLPPPTPFRTPLSTRPGAGPIGLALFLATQLIDFHKKIEVDRRRATDMLEWLPGRKVTPEIMNDPQKLLQEAKRRFGGLPVKTLEEVLFVRRYQAMKPSGDPSINRGERRLEIDGKRVPLTKWDFPILKIQDDHKNGEEPVWQRAQDELKLLSVAIKIQTTEDVEHRVAEQKKQEQLERRFHELMLELIRHKNNGDAGLALIVQLQLDEILASTRMSPVSSPLTNHGIRAVASTGGGNDGAGSASETGDDADAADVVETRELALYRNPVKQLEDFFQTRIEEISLRATIADLFLNKPERFWGALRLLQKGLPHVLIAQTVLGIRSISDGRQVLNALAALSPDSSVQEVLREMEGEGLRPHIERYHTHSADSSLASVALAQVERAIDGALYMIGVISEHEAPAAAAGTTLGVEHEFGGIETRDKAYEIMAEALERVGYDVEILTGGATRFVYDRPLVYTTRRGRMTWQGKALDYEILLGSGNTVILSVTPVDNPQLSESRRAIATNPGDAVSELYEMLRQHFGFRDVLEVRALASSSDHRFEYIVLVKDRHNDIFKMIARFDADSGKAKLSGLNGKFIGPDGELLEGIEIDAKGVDDVVLFLEGDMAGKEYAQKTDRYTGLKVEGLDQPFHVTYEAHPYLELVSPILKPDNLAVMDVIVDALYSAGAKGTSPWRLIGTHIHVGLPVTETAPDGTKRFTIEPVVNLLRRYVGDATKINAVVQSSPNRKAFIEPLPPLLAQKIMDPGFMGDPTDPVNILRIAADLAEMAKKYSALNVDNVLAVLLENLVNVRGLIKDVENTSVLKPGEVYQTVHNGEAYMFRVRGETPEDLSIVREIRVEKDGKTKIYEKELVRVMAGIRKPTAEKRIFNFVPDSETNRFFARFMAAWGWRYGTNYYLDRPEVKPDPYADPENQIYE